MLNFFLFLIWILVTLVITTIAAVLGKRYGVEVLVAAVSVLIVAANVLANKIVSVGSLVVPGGVIVFSMTFLLTDIICEKWGKYQARKAVWIGLFSQVVFVIGLWMVMKWPGPEFAAESAGMFSQVLALSPRIALASIVAYVISQNHDVWMYNFLKKKTKGKHMWLRNNVSTVISQLLDSVVFISIAFFGVMPIIPLILGQWVVKVFIAVLDTPFMYLSVNLMDKVKRKRDPVVLE